MAGVPTHAASPERQVRLAFRRPMIAHQGLIQILRVNRQGARKQQISGCAGQIDNGQDAKVGRKRKLLQKLLIRFHAIITRWQYFVEITQNKGLREGYGFPDGADGQELSPGERIARRRRILYDLTVGVSTLGFLTSGPTPLSCGSLAGMPGFSLLTAVSAVENFLKDMAISLLLIKEQYQRQELWTSGPSRAKAGIVRKRVHARNAARRPGIQSARPRSRPATHPATESQTFLPLV